MPIEGRVAIVTGVGNGLGRAHAMFLASRGARVVVNDLSPEAAQAVAAEIEVAGGTPFAFAASATDEAAITDLVASTLARSKRSTSKSPARCPRFHQPQAPDPPHITPL
jgi:NAD(P)-dependent dehydrogenase (short-subunit alcohol dehydrogenase family)